jgi:hypothetical protein
MNTTDIPNQQPTPTQPPLENQPISVSSTNWKSRLPLVIGILLVNVIVGVGGYLLGARSGRISTPTQPQNVSEQVSSTTSPSQIPDSQFGTSTISFADSGSGIYLKHTVNLNDNKIKFPNSELRTITKIYSQDDNSLEPQELTNVDSSKYVWTEMVRENIKDSVGSASILISDRLFSFRKMPNSNSFIFVVEWARSAGQNAGSWSPYQFERVLFYYNRSQSEGKLNKIQSFSDYPNNTKAYTYPKIDTFSQDNRYVSLQLFGCWNCGGHMPETLLFDTQTLKTKNIGKVVQFAWKQNGAYEYKDYVVVECKEPQPGECSQDPNSLPLKTGNF